jgi:hypothetical protein
MKSTAKLWDGQAADRAGDTLTAKGHSGATESVCHG